MRASRRFDVLRYAHQCGRVVGDRTAQVVADGLDPDSLLGVTAALAFFE